MTAHDSLCRFRFARRIGWRLMEASRGFMPVWHVGRVIHAWGWRRR